jgi:hypothetical protein
MEPTAIRPAEMNRKREMAALSVLQLVHDGIDPATGLPFTSNSWNSVVVVRALATAIDTLRRSTARRIRALPERVGAPWTVEEDRKLEESFAVGLPIAVLADKHSRTRGAITARLERLGKLSTPPTQQMPTSHQHVDTPQYVAEDRLQKGPTGSHLSPLHQLASSRSSQA